MTPIKKIREILVHWGMENTRVGAYTYESSGFVADHVWTVGDSLILKASGSLTGLKNSVDLSRALEKAGFSAALPVPTIGGEDYVTEEGVHYCLTRRLTGRSPLSRDLIRGDGKTNGEPIGRGIGRLHLALRELDGREEPAGLENTDLFASVRDWAIPKTRASMSLPEEFYTDYLSLFGELAPKLPVQIIHRDPNPSNLLLREDHTVGFVDFEAADRRVRLYDPCYTATAVLSETFAGPDGVLSRENWFSLYRGILSGYDGVCPLTPEERRAAPYVVFSIQMVCVAFFGGLEKFAELARINKEMLRWLWDNREKLTL